MDNFYWSARIYFKQFVKTGVLVLLSQTETQHEYSASVRGNVVRI